MTDSVKDKAYYSAEHRLDRWVMTEGRVKVFGTEWTPETVVRFSDVEDVQRYVDRVLGHIGCKSPIRVRRTRGHQRGHYTRARGAKAATISLVPRERGNGHTLNEVYVLHEIAHHLVPAGVGHGPQFTRALVSLLVDTGHPVLARMLEIALYEEGVPIDPA